MIKIKIAIDLDGVIFPTYEVLDKIFFEVFGREIDWRSFNCKSRFYLASEEGRWVSRRLKDGYFYKKLVIRDGVKKMLDSLINGKNNHRLIYWTVRPSLVNRETIYSLSRNSIPLRRIYYVNRKKAANSKLKIAGQERVNLIIENNPEVAGNLSEHCRVILFDPHHNKESSCKKRVYSWKDLEFLIAYK